MGTEGDFVIRAGYNRAYSRPGMNDYTGRLNANPGILIDASRNSGLNNLGAAPLLFRETSRLGAPTIPESPSYPLPAALASSINTFDPNLQVPSADSFSAGIQRGLGKNMALEVRYVGTRSQNGWAAPGAGVGGFNYNEFNITENGFLQEFRQAQRNLQANIAAGRGTTFAFTGAPGTAPLPIFLAYYNAQPGANAGNAAAYTGASWTNATFLGFLAERNPQPFNFASTNTTNGLQGNATFRNNAITAGLPENLFIANPHSASALVVKNYFKTRYNALQIELRRRYVQGLQFNTSYTYGHQYDNQFASFSRGEYWLRPSGNTGDIPHAFKANVIFELPFGEGRRWANTSNGVLKRIVGGWQIWHVLASPERYAGEHRQRPPRRHVDQRRAEDVQAALRRCQQARVHAAAGRHRQHDPRVQRQRHVAHRLQHPGRAGRPVFRAGERSGLRRDRQRRLR